MTEREVDHILAMLRKMCGSEAKKAHKAIIEFIAENPSAYTQSRLWLLREYGHRLGNQYGRSIRRIIPIERQGPRGIRFSDMTVWVPETAGILPRRSVYGYYAVLAEI